MSEKTLILEDLPADLDSVKSRLLLYFSNKRKSGGEVLDIRNYPDDKRKAFLLYLEDDDVRRVLERGTHKVDFKALGMIDLHVKIQGDEVKTNVKSIKSVPPPCPNLEKMTVCGKSPQDKEKAEAGTFCQKGGQQDNGGDKQQLLLVTSAQPITEEILKLYFEQFCDDIDICSHDNNNWIVKFTHHSDLRNVLAKKDHNLDGSPLLMQLYEFDPRRVILSGLSEDCKCSHLTVFIKSCSRGAEHFWEVLNDGERIAVTFKQDIDIEAFLKKCSSKKLKNMDITARHLEHTDTVLVQGNLGKLSEEALDIYFSSQKSKGGEIKNLHWVKSAESVLITFEDFQVAVSVAQQKHFFCGVRLLAQLFYRSLQQALSEEAPTLPAVPSKISLPVDALLFHYIQKNEACQDMFKSALQEIYTSIVFEDSSDPPQLVLEMAVDSESLLLYRLANTWETKAREEVETLLETLLLVKLTSTEEVWGRINTKNILGGKNASVSFNKNTIVLVGQKNDVKKLQDEIQLLMNKAKEELELEKNTVEKRIPLNSKEELDFVWNLVSSKLQGVEHSKDDINFTVCLKGLIDKVSIAQEIIQDVQKDLVTQTLNLSQQLSKFVQSLDLKKFERNHFVQISAVILTSGDSIQILAKKQDANKAISKIEEVIKEEVINLTPDQGKVTQDEHWTVFFRRLMQEVESSSNVQNVSISQTDTQIVVCGFGNVVADVARKLTGHLNNRMPVTEEIPLKSLRHVEYVDTCMKLSEFPEIKALDVTILSSRTEVSPCLRVTAASDKKKAAVDAVNKQVSCIVNERHMYSKAGESKVLEKHQAALKARAKEFECKLYLTREEKAQTNFGPIERYEAILNKKGYLPAHLMDKRISSPQNGTSLPAQKPNENTPPLLPPKPVAGQKVVIGGVTVLLNKGDITKEAVDAIVNSNNVNLDLDTGVSGAILRAAGKSVVDECTKLGTQKADGVVVTGGGNLNCKHIIQMVGPNTAADIVTSIEKVLQVCESKQITTVSIPAIGTGRGNIKPEDSIQAVLNGLENHLSQITSSCIKTIFIVAFDQKVFDSFHAYFVKRNQQSPRSQQAGVPRYSVHLQSRCAQLPANQVKINGIRVEVKKGDITKETVRGIVNTTNKDLNLKGGVSGAIFRAAGSLVEEECKKFVKVKGPVGDNGVVVTSGGTLQCDFIIHMAGPHTLAEVTSRVEKVLESCEKQGVTTVSFPAVGTGGGKLNATDVSIAMLRGFDNHLSQHSPTVLKLIYIVIDKGNVLQDFLQGLKKWSNIPLDNSSDADDEDEGSEGEDNWSTTCEVDDEGGGEDDASKSSIEIIIGPMKVKVLCGDIIDEKTDAIVNSTNTSLSLNSGVSGAILRAAGQEVVKECKALGTQPDDGVVVTKPGKLQSKNIIHMVGQTKAKDITNSMYKVLGTCDLIKAQSVSFPALGTGAGNLGAFQVASAMIDAVSNFVLDKPKSSLKAIHIVLFQKKMMSDFEQVMKKFKKVTPNPGLAATPQKKLYTTLPNLSQSQTSPNTTITNLADTTANVTFPVMVAEVYGVSAANLAQVKRCLDELVAEECTSQDVETEHLHLLTESEKQAIAAMSQKDQVQIQVLQNKLKVTGKTNDVLLAIQHIKDSLQRARERENLEREEKRLKKTICWEVEKSQSWKSLDPRTNYNVELAFHRKDQLWTYQDRGVSFTVDFKNMTQKDSRGNTMKIKRTLLGDSETAIIDPPPTWTKLDGKDLDVIALPSESEEFKTISEEFLLSCQWYNQESGKLIEVVQIQRIQNQEQWQRYAVSKQAVDRKYPKSTNEQFLYHGTTKEICQKINKNGFNRSFCGRNATKFGNGTYFAKEAYYSCHNSYSKPDEEGNKYIYRARVLTGKPCIGNKDMKEPSPVDPNNDQAGLHDCAVDNLQNPFIFVIFCDSGAYPDYLITFKVV